MLKSAHAQTLNKPYCQIKDLKLYYPDDLATIKESHKQLWQIFKSFILTLYKSLPHDFAKPHIESWCNGWQIRNHYFAYFKYECYLANAPIISVIFNKQRLMVQLDWHDYKSKFSHSTVSQFNNWLNHIDVADFADFYYYHCQVSEYDELIPIGQFCIDSLDLSDGSWCKLARVIEKDELDKFSDDKIMAWTKESVLKLSEIYLHCHNHNAE